MCLCQAKQLPFSGLYLEFQGTQLQMADGCTRAITPEECVYFLDYSEDASMISEAVKKRMEQIADGCRWKSGYGDGWSGIVGVSPLGDYSIVLPCTASRAPSGYGIASGFWTVCWDRVAQITAHTTAIDNLVTGLLLDNAFYSMADSDQSPRLSEMGSGDWLSLAIQLGHRQGGLTDVQFLALVMEDVRTRNCQTVETRIVSDGVAFAAIQRAC